MDIGLKIPATDYTRWDCTTNPCWTDYAPRMDSIWLPSDMIDAADEGTYYVVCPNYVDPVYKNTAFLSIGAVAIKISCKRLLMRLRHTSLTKVLIARSTG